MVANSSRSSLFFCGIAMLVSAQTSHIPSLLLSFMVSMLLLGIMSAEEEVLGIGHVGISTRK
jgi:hypothetical protein